MYKVTIGAERAQPSLGPEVEVSLDCKRKKPAWRRGKLKSAAKPQETYEHVHD